GEARLGGAVGSLLRELEDLLVDGDRPLVLAAEVVGHAERDRDRGVVEDRLAEQRVRVEELLDRPVDRSLPVGELAETAEPASAPRAGRTRWLAGHRRGLTPVMASVAESTL